MGKNNAWLVALKFAPIIYALLFFAFPILCIAYFSVFSAYSDFYALFSYALSKHQLFYNAFVQAIASTLLSLALGLAFAYIIATKKFPFRRFLGSAMLLPYVFPSILVVLSFVIILGNNGWVNQILANFFGLTSPVKFLYGFWGVVLAHAFYNFSLVAKLVSDSWRAADLAFSGAAKTLGASPSAEFLHITLPQLLPSIVASASLVFIYCFMSFAIVLSLGGFAGANIEVQIYEEIFRRLDFASAGIFAAFQFAFLSLFTFAYLHFSKKTIRSHGAKEKLEPIEVFTPLGLIQSIFLLAMAIAIFLPIIALIMFSFFPDGAFSLRSFEKIFNSGPSVAGTTPLLAIVYSLLIAAMSSLVSTLFAFLSALRASKNAAVSYFLASSIAVSGATLALGYYLSFGAGNLLVIALAHSVICFPFAYRIINNSISKIPIQTYDAAQSLGAGVFEIISNLDFALTKRAIFASVAFGFAVSLGELALVLSLYNGEFATMGVYIYRLISSFDLPAASAMGLILISISMLCFYAIEYVSSDAEAI